MRYNPATFKEAYEIASRLDHETKAGVLDVRTCPNCNVNVFIVEGYVPNSMTAYGYCLNPRCRHDLSADEAEDAAFEDRVFKHS